ncbi:hypothetical protein ACFXS9_00535 [Bradyrhizobium sp. RDI18]
MGRTLCGPTDEGVAQPLLLEIDRDARSEDTFVETDQSVHVGGDKRQVMYVVEQLHVYLRGFHNNERRRAPAHY